VALKAKTEGENHARGTFPVQQLALLAFAVRQVRIQEKVGYHLPHQFTIQTSVKRTLEQIA